MAANMAEHITKRKLRYLLEPSLQAAYRPNEVSWLSERVDRLTALCPQNFLSNLLQHHNSETSSRKMRAAAAHVVASLARLRQLETAEGMAAYRAKLADGTGEPLKILIAEPPRSGYSTYINVDNHITDICRLGRDRPCKGVHPNHDARACERQVIVTMVAESIDGWIQCPFVGCGKRIRKNKIGEHNSEFHTCIGHVYMCTFDGCNRFFNRLTKALDHGRTHRREISKTDRTALAQNVVKVTRSDLLLLFLGHLPWIQSMIIAGLRLGQEEQGEGLDEAESEVDEDSRGSARAQSTSSDEEEDPEPRQAAIALPKSSPPMQRVSLDALEGDASDSPHALLLSLRSARVQGRPLDAPTHSASSSHDRVSPLPVSSSAKPSAENVSKRLPEDPRQSPQHAHSVQLAEGASASEATAREAVFAPMISKRQRDI